MKPVPQAEASEDVGDWIALLEPRCAFMPSMLTCEHMFDVFWWRNSAISSVNHIVSRDSQA